MSVEVTRLPSGLVVVTDAMPHLHTASLGCWVACGSRKAASEKGLARLEGKEYVMKDGDVVDFRFNV